MTRPAIPDAEIFARLALVMDRSAPHYDEAEALRLVAALRDVNLQDEKGRCALLLAAQNGNVTVIKALLDRGADVNRKDRQDRTALWAAAWWGYSDTAALLISRGADAESWDDEGRTPLDIAEEEDNWDTLLTMRRAIAAYGKEKAILQISRGIRRPMRVGPPLKLKRRGPGA